MMVAMMRRPPEHAFLTGRLREEGKTELPGAIEFKGTMTEIPMVASRDAKHAQEVRAEQPRNDTQLEWRRKDEQDGSMKHQKRHHRREVIGFAFDCELAHEKS